MKTLMAAILLGAAFGHVMRMAQGGKCRMLWVGAVNYISACVMSVIAWRLAFRVPLGAHEVAYGIVGGASWAMSYLLLDVGIRLAGVSITQCVGWLGIAVPVPLSALFFGEALNGSQYAGLAAMVVALFLLAPGETSNVRQKSRWAVPALLGVFASEGVICMAMKGFEVSLKSHGAELQDVDSRIPGLLIFLFGAAGTGLLAIGILRRIRPAGRDVGYGIGLGATAFLGNLAFMRAVNRIPAPVMFPGYWAGVIVVTGIASMLLWRERYRFRAWLGMFAALLTMIFVSVDVFGLLRNALAR